MVTPPATGDIIVHANEVLYVASNLLHTHCRAARFRPYGAIQLSDLNSLPPYQITCYNICAFLLDYGSIVLEVTPPVGRVGQSKTLGKDLCLLICVANEAQVALVRIQRFSYITESPSLPP